MNHPLYGKWTIFYAIEDTHLRYRPVEAGHVHKMYAEDGWSYEEITRGLRLLVQAGRFDDLGEGKYQRHEPLTSMSTTAWRTLESQWQRRQQKPKVPRKRLPKSPTSCVYLLQAEGLSPVKIGHTASVLTRMKALQPGSPVRLHVLREIPTTDRVQLEQRLHKRYAPYKVHGEWFDLPPHVLQQLLNEDFTPRKGSTRDA